jgi:Ca2+-binding RTX toxin-like protein
LAAKGALAQSLIGENIDVFHLIFSGGVLMPNPIVWSAARDIYATSGTDRRSVVSAARNGWFSVSWNGDQNNGDINNLVFVADGATPVNGLGVGGAAASVSSGSAFLTNGMFVLAWSEAATVGGDADIKFAIRNNSEIGFSVVTTGNVANAGVTAGNQVSPVVAALTNGNFAVTWVDLNDNKQKVRVFDVTGAPVSGVTNVNPNGSTVNPHGQASQYSTNITALAGGGFAICDHNSSSSLMTIFGAAGNIVAADIPLITNTNADSAIVQLSNGNIATISSVDGFQPPFNPILNRPGGYATRMFTSSGVPIGADFYSYLPDDVPFQSYQLRATAFLDGRFMVVSSSFSEGSVGNDIWARVFRADGTSDAPAFRVNDSTVGVEIAPSITTMADGRVAVTWTDVAVNNGDIFLKIYDPRETGVTLVGTSIGDDYVGSRFNDDIRTGAGEDTIDGGDGNDYLQAGPGKNVVHGGDGVDQLSFYDLAGGVTFALGAAGSGEGIFDALGTIVIYDGIESIAGSDYGFAQANFALGADNLTGNDLDNTIDGYWGNDTLYGMGGNDTIRGGRGADTMFGGKGDDTYDVDDFGDHAVEQKEEGKDTVNSSVSYIMDAEIENVNLTGLSTNDGVLGNRIANVINGNDGDNGIASGDGNDTINAGAGNDVLDGGIGADAMSGGLGSDVYFVDNLGDLALDETAEADIYDTVWTTVNFTLPDEVEILILNGGVLAINGTGSAGASGINPNLVLGNNAVNVLTTFGGDDIILALDGNDTINAGGSTAGGYNLIIGGKGNDTMTTGSGHDYFSYTNISEGGDTINGFQTAGGLGLDIFDLRTLFGTFHTFAGNMPAQAVAGGFLTFTQVGGDTQVLVDANGGVHNPGEQILLATLVGTTAAAVQNNTLV